MDSIEQELTGAALRKFQIGEPLSVEDMTRVLNVFEHSTLGFTNVNPEVVAAMKVRLQNILRRQYFGETPP